MGAKRQWFLVENYLMKKIKSFPYGWKDSIFIFIGFSFTAHSGVHVCWNLILLIICFLVVCMKCEIDTPINCRCDTCRRSTIKIVFITHLSNFLSLIFWGINEFPFSFVFSQFLTIHENSVADHVELWKVFASGKQWKFRKWVENKWKINKTDKDLFMNSDKLSLKNFPKKNLLETSTQTLSAILQKQLEWKMAANKSKHTKVPGSY